MSPTLIGVVTLIYLYVAVDLYIKGNWPLGMAYTGYAFANIGLLTLANGFKIPS